MKLLIIKFSRMINTISLNETVNNKLSRIIKAISLNAYRPILIKTNLV